MKKWLIIVLVFMLLFGGGCLGLYIQLIPRIKEYGKMEVQRFNQLIVSHCYFKDLVVIERGNDNTIELLDFDMIKVNQLSTKIAQDIETTYAQIEEGKFKANDDSYYQRKMQQVSQDGILSKVSVMSLLRIPIFNSISPTIKIKYKHLSSVSTSIKKSIKNYGVNHVMVELAIEINMKLSMVYPFFEQYQTHQIQIPILLEIFQGQVPLVYSQ
ncbi:MAG: sporulation protein YunB [Coprobacillus sp.]